MEKIEFMAENKQYKYDRVSNVVEKLYEEGIVKDRSVQAVIFDMCDASINVIQRSRDKHKDVWCSWDNGAKEFKYEPALFEMMKDCIQYKDGVNLEIWRYLYGNYIENNCNSELKVTWDRINDKKEKGNYNYTLDNMQPLSRVANITKGRAKPLLFFLYERKGLKEVVKGKFESIKDIKRHLINNNILTNVNVDNLIDRARKEGGTEEWQPVEFIHNKKLYLIQMTFTN